MHRILRNLAVLFALVGVGVTAAGIWQMTTSVCLVRDGEKTMAVVVAQERTSSQRRPGETPTTLFRPTLEFVDPATGEKVQKRTASSSNTYNYRIGSEVEIYVALDGSAEPTQVGSFVGRLWCVSRLVVRGTALFVFRLLIFVVF